MDISSLTPGKQVKLQYWLDVIRQCRASGMTNQDWCEQNAVSLKSYYYWLAKIRKLGVAVLLTYSPQNGVILLVMAFLISPMGLPLAAIWLLGKVQSLKFAIQDRVYG